MVGKILKSERKKKGLTQAQLARLANLNQSAISKIETNQNGMRINTLIKVCKVLNISPSLFLEFLEV